MRSAVLAAALALAAASSAQAVELRLASTTVPTSKVNVWGLIPWSEDVKKASNDMLDIKVYFNNSIANPDNVYDRTVQGVADISFGIMGPFYDLFPRTMVAGLPFEANNDTETSVALSRLFARGLISEEYSKVKVLALFTFAPSAVNSNKVNAYLDQNLPETIEADWRAVVLNQDLWENTGSALMLWSGAHEEAPGAALHEGGHGFHQLADEYCASNTGSRCGDNTDQSGQSGEEWGEINSTGTPEDTAGKWDRWLGVTQVGLRG